jgi:hypothetical protein
VTWTETDSTRLLVLIVAMRALPSNPHVEVVFFSCVRLKVKDANPLGFVGCGCEGYYRLLLKGSTLFGTCCAPHCANCDLVAY